MKNRLAQVAARVAVLAAASIPAPVLAEPLAPSSPWVVVTDENSCQVRRMFGAGNNSYLLQLDTKGIGTGFGVMVLGRFPNMDRAIKVRWRDDAPFKDLPVDMRLRLADEGPAPSSRMAIMFSPGIGLGPWTRTSLEPFPAADAFLAMSPEERTALWGRAVSMYGAMSKSELEAYRERARAAPEPDRAVMAAFDKAQDAWIEDMQRNADTLTIGWGVSSSVSLATGGLYEPAKAIRDCAEKRLAGWGIDVERYKAASKPPKPIDQARWAGEIQKNYPDEAERAMQDAALSLVLILDETGKPVECKSTFTFEPSSFRKTACDILLKEARFEPSLDKDGVPFKALWTMTIRYRME